MTLSLNHKKLEVYKISRFLVKECYLLTALLPVEEKFNPITQIRRVALSAS
ncbi:four helix bundle protein [Sediminibacterium sp. KACHI17]|uniref:four helix bundle protein n=1 Tax=Sediminibacterium sp. KACHI17 TaxID=1751071 RepID=UPI0033652FEE